MIEAIEFTNFKALRKTNLPLAPFTLLLGPNGSGKTTVLQALQAVATVAAQKAGVQRQDSMSAGMAWASLVSVTAKEGNAKVEIKLRLRLKKQLMVATFEWQKAGPVTCKLSYESPSKVQQEDERLALEWLGRMQIYALDSSAIANPVPVNSGASLQP